MKKLGFAIPVAASSLLLGAGSAKAIGLDDQVAYGMSVGTLIIAIAILAFFSFLLAQIVPAFRRGGKAIGSILVGIVAVMLLAVAVTPAQVTSPSERPATFDILGVNVTNGNLTQATNTITAVLSVNKAQGTINSPKFINVNFTIQRTDPGQTTDIKTITASYSPATITDPVTGVSYSTAKPNSDGKPNVNWTLTGTTVAIASRTLTAQMGMTPYQTGSIAVNIEWNPSAFTTSNVAVNMVIDAGTISIGGTVYTLQVLITRV